MNDRELLEMAAKAAGIVNFWDGDTSRAGAASDFWNPLNDDGDALRLAVKLRVTVEPREHMVAAAPSGYPMCVIGEMYTDNGENEGAATRRAIVRAAAEIGRSMQ